jgi:hypothetical protein
MSLAVRTIQRGGAGTSTAIGRPGRDAFFAVVFTGVFALAFRAVIAPVFPRVFAPVFAAPFVFTARFADFVRAFGDLVDRFMSSA